MTLLITFLIVFLYIKLLLKIHIYTTNDKKYIRNETISTKVLFVKFFSLTDKFLSVL